MTRHEEAAATAVGVAIMTEWASNHEETTAAAALIGAVANDERRPDDVISGLVNVAGYLLNYLEEESGRPFSFWLRKVALDSAA